LMVVGGVESALEYSTAQTQLSWDPLRDHHEEEMSIINTTEESMDAKNNNKSPEQLLQKAVVDFGLMLQLAVKLVDLAKASLNTRLVAGLHVGPAIGGVLGTDRLVYDVFGATVNTTSRVMSTALTADAEVTERDSSPSVWVTGELEHYMTQQLSSLPANVNAAVLEKNSKQKLLTSTKTSKSTETRPPDDHGEDVKPFHDDETSNASNADTWHDQSIPPLAFDPRLRVGAPVQRAMRGLGQRLVRPIFW
jgi:hypothetical protein